MKKIEDIFKSLDEVALDLSVSKGEVSNNDTLNLSRQIILATPRPDPIGSNDSDIFYDGLVSSSEKTKEDLEKEKKKKEERKKLKECRSKWRKQEEKGRVLQQGEEQSHLIDLQQGKSSNDEA